jgi:hypothetical protein
MTVIAIEDVVSAEELAALKAEVASTTVKMVEEVVIPIILNAVPLTHTTLKPTATVTLTLEQGETEGQLVLKNNVDLGLEFIPARTYDMFEEVQREIAKGLYVAAVQRFSAHA